MIETTNIVVGPNQSGPNPQEVFPASERTQATVAAVYQIAIIPLLKLRVIVIPPKHSSSSKHPMIAAAVIPKPILASAVGCAI